MAEIVTSGLLLVGKVTGRISNTMKGSVSYCVLNRNGTIDLLTLEQFNHQTVIFSYKSHHGIRGS